MGRIPDETIQAIRDRVDLVELIGRYVHLRSSGRSAKGLCPFHDEKTPSFHVNADRQIFHCFGCGVGGNAFTFLMRHENLTFPEVVRELGRQVGIAVQDAEGPEAGIYERLREVNDRAQAFFREELRSPRGAVARAYLEGRGVDAALAERFGIGFAPDAWDALESHLRREKIPAEMAARAGLLAERPRGGHYDRLRGRITFPIRDARGRVLGFGGRALGKEQEPKYLNGPETPVYRKREVLFGLPAALEPMRRTGRAVVVEGYFDVVALHRADVCEAVATCGTALTEEHAAALRRRTREVVLLFDGDDAGRRALRGALETLLPAALRVRAVRLPAGDDPDSFLARAGAEALRRLVEEAPPALDVLVAEACDRGIATPWERADAVHAVAPLLARVQDPVERGEFTRLLGMRSGVREEDVDAAVRAARRGESQPEAAPAKPPPSRGSDTHWFRNLAAAVVDQPELAGRVPLDELAADWPDAPARLVLDAIVRAVLAGGEPEMTLAGDALRLYTELEAVERERYDADGALRALDETLHKLRYEHHRRERASTRRAARAGEIADGDLLARKQEEVRRRRALLQPPSGSTRH